MTTPTIRLRLDFGPGLALGPGKVELLEHIRDTGSLAQAASALGMSYRRAWALLQDLNELYSEPLATLSRGGRGGGGAELTGRGRAVVAAFRATELRATRAAERAFARLGTPQGRRATRAGVRRLTHGTKTRRLHG
jgi:molybdate transport system regulatory protein